LAASSNENINDLISQYLPKGADLSGHSQEQLDAIAYELNIRPRQSFNCECSTEMMMAMMTKHPKSQHLTQ
jgi:IS30 family transposase